MYGPLIDKIKIVSDSSDVEVIFPGWRRSIFLSPDEARCVAGLLVREADKIYEINPGGNA